LTALDVSLAALIANPTPNDRATKDYARSNHADTDDCSYWHVISLVLCSLYLRQEYLIFGNAIMYLVLVSQMVRLSHVLAL
jgi:hypothetical protein